MTPSMDFRSRARSVREAARKQLQQLRDERMAQRPRRLPAEGAEAPADRGEGEEAPASAPLPDPVLDMPGEAEGDTLVSEVEAPAFEHAAAEAVTEEEAPSHLEGAAAQPVAPPRVVAKRKPGPKKSVKRMPPPLDSPEETQIRRAALAEMFDGQVAPAPRRISAVAAPPVPDEVEKVEEVEPAEVQDAQPLAAAPQEPSPVSADEPPQETEAEGAPQVPEMELDDLADLPGAGPGLVWMLRQCGIGSLAELAECDIAKLSSDLGLVGQILDVSLWRDYAQRQLAGLVRAS